MERKAILSRTNIALFENALQLRSQRIPFHFERDITPLLYKTLDVFWLSKQNHDRIKEPFIKTFDSLDHLDLFADKMDDIQLNQMSNIVKKHENEFPGIIFEMTKEKSNHDDAPEDTVILSSVHSAKGQEYNHVFLDSDIANHLQSSSKNDQDSFAEEINVAYVGLTRAVDHLYLHSAFQDILTPEWKKYIGRFRTPFSEAKSGFSNQTKQRSSQKSRSKSSRIQNRGVKSWTIGQKVKTSLGPGKIIELTGRRCLVDLDNQTGKLWEDLSNIN